MNFTATITSKNQFTLPKAVVDKLKIKKGGKFNIFPIPDGSFIGIPKRKSNIMNFSGDLKSKDDGWTWKEIREKTDRIMAGEYRSEQKK